jgi:hypothetical protein
MMVYKHKYQKEIKEELGEIPSWRYDREKFDKYKINARKFAHNKIFNAEPGDARVYATKGSATASVGVFNRDRIGSRTYILPDHLEIHEIKESFVCVLRPDGSSNCDDEETK